MLQSEVDYRDSRIRKLEADLAATGGKDRELAEVKARLERLEKAVRLRDRSRGRRSSRLRPPQTEAPQPLARGARLPRLEPSRLAHGDPGPQPEAETQINQLWLIIDGKPVSGGVFDARQG
jgi:uncharacterized protein involved in type VI secretion and phage assembly